MTDEKESPGAPLDGIRMDAAPLIDDLAPDAPAPADDAGSAAAARVDELQAENAALKDRMLRTLAEMENLRRRTEREVADARLYGVTKFAGDMLVVSDNIHRGIESLGDELRNSADPGLKSFIEGVQLTDADFQSRLLRHGVKKLSPQGEKFDPNKHEALFEVPDSSVPAGTVVQVVEAGYTIGERTLRPAKVGVSRAG